jgi:hypothetical protein
LLVGEEGVKNLKHGVLLNSDDCEKEKASLCIFKNSGYQSDVTTPGFKGTYLAALKA